MDPKMYLRVVLILLQVLCNMANVEFSSQTESHDALVAMGKIQYDVIALDSQMPRYGPCWKQALRQLDAGCKKLDDDTQSRLALAFANCFLEKAGLRTYPCELGTPISECVNNIDSNAFTTYANFFTHTQNMCYFLQSQIWREATEETVQRLAVSSDQVSRSMQESNKLQDRILQGQHLTMEYQRKLIENGSMLSQALEMGKDNVKQMLAEFKSSTDEQRSLIFEVFDRVSRLQNLVISEVNWLYTVVFYGTCLLVIYIVTATKRTADARLVLFVILSLNLAIERIVCNYSLPVDATKVPTELSDTIYERIWLVRKIAIGLCTTMLTICMIRYKDYNIINNTLLQEIKKQNLELKHSMQMFQVHNRSTYQSNYDDIVDGKSSSVHHYDPALSVLLSEETGFQGDEEGEEYDYEDDSDNESYDSTRTDTSYAPGCGGGGGGDWSDDEFETAENSREGSTGGNTTPTNEALLDNALNSLLDSQLATGGGMAAYSHVQEFTTPIKYGDNQCVTTPRGGVSGGARASIRKSLQTPIQDLMSTPSSSSQQQQRQSFRGRKITGSASKSSLKDRQEAVGERYNLRSRTPGSGGSVGGMSPVLEETPEQFAKTVKAQLSKTMRNRLKWDMAMKNHTKHAGYSSDEGS